jgi:hypothetical protein
MLAEIVLVEPVWPLMARVHGELEEFRLKLGVAPEAEGLRRRVDGCLFTTKTLTLIAYRYARQHDFFNRVRNPFRSAEEPRPASDTEHGFQVDHGLVLTGLSLEIESFHLFASILLDRLARLAGHYFKAEVLIGVPGNHDKFIPMLKQPGAPFSPELVAEAEWLQKHVDAFRNRVIAHPEEYEEKQGYVGRGVKNPLDGNARVFRRKPHDPEGSADLQTMGIEEICRRLALYVAELTETLAKRSDLSVV